MAIDDPHLTHGALATNEDPDAVDQEEDVSGGGEGKPWDASKIRITTKNFTLREISTQIKDEEIDLAPDFQRAFVWKARQRTRLVESILLGIPLPAFYFNQEKDGAYQVVDGVQRLTTAHRFMEGHHTLAKEDLEYLKHLDGQNYAGLDVLLRRRFAATQIVVHVIEPQTPDELKYDIFSRVNTLGSPLSAQEIRHAMSKPRARDFLRDLVALPSFDAATGRVFWRRGPDGFLVREDHRMMDRELALRFCAFCVTPLPRYGAFESLDAFLLEMTRSLDGRPSKLEPIGDDELAALRVKFDRAMQNAAEILGPTAFRRVVVGQGRRGPLNRALFEAQALALVDHQLATLAPRKQEVQEALHRLIAEPEYLGAVTQATGDRHRVWLRLESTREAVLRALA